MPKRHAPRHGSMAYSPRTRARRIYPRVRTWPQNISDKKLLGFAGYKAGMTHTFVLDEHKDTATSNKEVFTPVTVIECPSIIPFMVRSYKKTPYGLQSSGVAWAEKMNKNLTRRIKLPKSPSSDILSKLSGDELTVLVHTLPSSVPVGSKTPEIMEVALGGFTFEEKLNTAKEILGKEISVADLYKEGELVDVIAVTKGKGFQGPVKRFGIRLQGRKAKNSGKGRHVGSLGGRGSATKWTVPMAGQMGYSTRTEYNKRIIKIGKKGENITPSGGFSNYGIVNNDFILVKGSVPGPVKRLVRFRPSIRPITQSMQPKVAYISIGGELSNEG